MSSSNTRTGPDLPGAILGSGISFVVAAVALWFCTYACFRQVQPDDVLDWRRGAVASAQYFLSWTGFSLPQRRGGTWPGAPSWRQIDAYYRRYPVAMRAIKVSTWVGAVGGAALASWLFVLLIQPRKREVRVSGTRLVTRAEDFERSLDDKPDGIHLHPKVRISRERESRHLLLIGATGTGKTQVISHVIRSAVDSGDSLIVYDFKGDQTSKYFHQGAALLAPWDARGWALAVGRDVTSKEHARTLAEALIPDSGSEAIWTSAARIVATAAFCSCIDEKPGRWTFSDALEQLSKGDEELCAVVRRYAPEGLRLVEDMRSRTTQSILITLASHISPIESLAKAWAGTPESRTLSVSEWLRNGVPQVVLLQGNGELQPLAAALHAAVFRVLLASVAAPSLTDSCERRRWFFGDEFLQLGRVTQLVPLLQVARSKGVRFVLAAQDVPGMRSVYGADGADAVLGAAGTTIITGTSCSVTREWAAKLAGTETVERLEVSRSYTPGGASDTERWAEVTRPVLKPEDLAAKLGQFRQGSSVVTRALIIGARAAVGLLDWPRLELPNVAVSHKPAAWLLRPPAASRPYVDEQPEASGADEPQSSVPQGDLDPHEPNDPPRRRLIIRKRGD